MKNVNIWVYFDKIANCTICSNKEILQVRQGWTLLQNITCEFTDEPISSSFEGNGIEIGEIFVSNGYDNQNLIRIS